MTTALLFTIALVFTSISYARPLRETVQGTILINDPAWAPYFFGGAVDAPPGLVKEIFSSCLDQEKLNYAYKHMAIERMQVEIEEGKLDINFFSYKPERAAYLDFGKEPLFVASYRPIVRADSTIEIRKLPDFDKYRLGHTIGMRYSKEFYDYILKRKAQGSLDETASNESNLLKLVHNRIDMFIATEDTAFYLADRLQLRDQIRILPYLIQSASYSLSISKKSSRIQDRALFLKTMDQCFEELKKTGIYCHLASKYKVPCEVKNDKRQIP